MNKHEIKLSRMSEKLGGIDKYGDEYLKDAKKRRNVQRKYNNLAMQPTQFEKMMRESLSKSEFDLF